METSTTPVTPSSLFPFAPLTDVTAHQREGVAARVLANLAVDSPECAGDGVWTRCQGRYVDLRASVDTRMGMAA